jgi:hypothetical protein
LQAKSITKRVFPALSLANIAWGKTGRHARRRDFAREHPHHFCRSTMGVRPMANTFEDYHALNEAREDTLQRLAELYAKRPDRTVTVLRQETELDQCVADLCMIETAFQTSWRRQLRDFIEKTSEGFERVSPEGFKTS